MHWTRGRVTRQAHVGVPEGTFEEEYARRGFFGRTSHLYRSHSPCAWTALEGDLRPHALAVDELVARDASGGDWLARRVPFLRNADVTIGMARLESAMPYAFRNADGDEVLFAHKGEGVLETDFGPLEYRAGQYLVVPRGTSYRLSPRSPSMFLFVESVDEIEIPDRGPLGRHALFDLDVLEVPTPALSTSGGGWAPNGEYVVKVKRADRISAITYPFDPFDVVGWKGDLAAFRLDIADIRPVASERYHLPPSVHTTFLARNVVLCTFLPRPLEVGDPLAMKVPFFHSNIDFDEVLFYHAGDFFSRAGVRAGMATFHPQGIHHGPQPQAVDAARDKQRTEEQAVMIDTRRPLELTEEGRAVSMPDYWKSWSRPSEKNAR